VVAEVAPDLADDRRDRIREERAPALGVEAVDRLHEPDRARLDEILDRLARAPVAPRELPDEREVPLDETRARGRIAALAQEAQVGLVREPGGGHSRLRAHVLDASGGLFTPRPRAAEDVQDRVSVR
jgi:hypothetical protein